MALIRFVVENQNLITENEFLGQYTLPLLCMRKGNIPKSKMIVLTVDYNFLPETYFDTTNWKPDIKEILYIDTFSLGGITEIWNVGLECGVSRKTN